MKKEIGGYLDFEENRGKVYHENMVELNNGRNCLRYLIRSKKIERIYLPSFLCDEVIKAVMNEGIAYETYQISKDFIPMIESLEKNAFLYVVNFYGQLSNLVISMLKLRFENIIIDNTQAFFQKPVLGVDTLYTCRKYFGVPDGGYLKTDNRLVCFIERDISHDRMEHLIGRYEENASKFYEVYQKNDAYFNEVGVKGMSKLTQNLLKGIDYEYVKKTRNQNFHYLHHFLGEINNLNLLPNDAPFAYPFYQKNGNKLKEFLIKHQIYVPTLWPNVLNMPEDTLEYEYANNIVPLPVDQRYGIEEMSYIIDVINEFRRIK